MITAAKPIRSHDSIKRIDSGKLISISLPRPHHYGQICYHKGGLYTLSISSYAIVKPTYSDAKAFPGLNRPHTMLREGFDVGERRNGAT